MKSRGQEEQERVLEVVFEDEFSVAYIPENPIDEGHVVVRPRMYYESLMTIPSVELGNVMMVARRIAAAVMDATHCQSVDLWHDSSVEGFCVHVIPRRSCNSPRMVVQQERKSPLEEIAEKIRYWLG